MRSTSRSGGREPDLGPVRVEQDFVTAENFHPPRRATTADTPMGTAIVEGLELPEQRKALHREPEPWYPQ